MTDTYPLVALVILDGWGLAPPGPGNAVAAAATPVFDRLWDGWPRTTLVTCGRAVGLPDGQMGNSEVGHLNIGAGRVVWQDLTRIDNAITDGSFFDNAALRAALAAPRAHLVGLVSDGGVHSSERHLAALVELSARLGRRGDDLVIHAITDGRDTSPTAGRGYLTDLQATCARHGAGVIGTVVGRYHAMDRDRRWPRIETAFRALVEGAGETTDDVLAAIAARYAAGETDEFLAPIVAAGAPRIGPGEPVVFFNFRADRGRQLSLALGDPSFEGFARGPAFAPVALTTMTRYRDDFPYPVAFAPERPQATLGEVVAEAGLTQLRIAETEKYAHVTYFFSGGDETERPRETRTLVPSPPVATYDLQPAMSAVAVTDAACEAVRADHPSLIVLNYANADMVGHTGVFEAAVQAVETVDTQLGRVVGAVEAAGGACIVTADHGNAEQMIDPRTGGPHTAHTTNPVPLVLVGGQHREATLAEGAALEAIAPTICRLLGLARPAQMTGPDLLA